MDTKQMEEQAKKFTTEWHKRMEELQLQFSLGKMDAGDAFEKQKDHLRNMVVSIKEQLDTATGLAEEKGIALKSKLEDLRLQLSLGKADGTEVFEEQKKKIEMAIHEVYDEGKKALSTGYDQMLQLFDNGTTAFKTGLEVVKLQYALGKMEAGDEQQKVRKELSDKMNELNEQFKNAQHTAMHTMEEFSKQLKEGFEKMKTLTEGWMKK
ncbi:MAG: hypothetical protein H7296_13415 [Bacteroidia bacterium]|nr:hypothetical protein [Bacteroidia bacterium]